MPPRRFTIAFALLIAVAAPRRSEAGLIPWSYQWNAQPIVIDADPPSPNDKPGGITLTPGAITITGGNQGVARGSANIDAVSLTAFNFSPGQYRFTNASYHLGVTLTDVNSKQSGTLRFAGLFDGSFTDWKMDLNMHFTSATQQSLILGANRYTVTLTTYTPPAPPSQGKSGDISAFVKVQPVHAPEPTSLILAGSGLLVAVLTWFRRSTYPKFLFR
jgi:hypothetical protein